MEFNNTEKFKHGQNAKLSLEEILEKCLAYRYIKAYVKEYRVGLSGYSKSQFYAPFLIEFHDGEKWIIYTSTSMRTDRIKGQQWDASNIKNIDGRVTKALLVYSISVSEKINNEFINQKEKYMSKKEISAIDDILNQLEFMDMVEENANKHLKSGQRHDIEGRNFENRIAEILSSKTNLEIWKFGENKNVGLNFGIFKDVMEKIHPDKNSVRSVNASADRKRIGKLKTGGNPKTDIIIDVECTNGEVKSFCFSCKRSSKDWVSVHEYSADSFVDALNENDAELRDLLNAFQNTPTLSEFGDEKQLKLKDCLSKYNEKLFKWVISGKNGEIENQNQIATHILIYNDNQKEVNVYSIDDYLQHLKDNNVIGHFGTMFRWTYPSKKRGKKIQLKGKII